MKHTRLYKEAGRAMAVEPARDSIANELAQRPTRYVFEPRPLKDRKGMTKRCYMQPVRPGEPRYDEAPFETTIVWHEPQPV